MTRSLRRSYGLLVALCFLPGLASAQTYSSFREAMAAGQTQLRSRNFAGSQAPLEAALQLAKTDEQRFQAYEALQPAYRQLPDIDKMTEAYEFIVRHTDTTAGRSLSAAAYASFVYQRGQGDKTIERYEARLKQDRDDLPALSALSALYSRTRRDKKERENEVETRLKRLNTEMAVKKAETLEQQAEENKMISAWLWKNAAIAWLEAEDPPRARKAAEKSLQAPPEARTEILTMMWREGLGDVFLAAGDKPAATREYAEAVKVAPSDPLRKNVEKKLGALETAEKK